MRRMRTIKLPLDDSGLCLAFNVLADKSTSLMLRQSAAQVLYDRSPEFLGACANQDLPLDVCIAFAQGARAAMNAAPINSQVESMCCVIWDHMLSALFRKSPTAAAQEIRDALLDPTLKKFSIGATQIAAYLSTVPVLSGGNGWGKTPSQAMKRFTGDVAAVQSLLRPGSASARKLAQSVASVQSGCGSKPA